ncbi:hypothetical protein ACFWPX_29645 [Nocardia sp. NPDC058518]|uniref:hypothetical protein n=1 Tax=Nocardia sp. NPDC058518 TaxID=3346534 RepID=UPI0036568A9C
MIVSKWTAAHVFALREYALREEKVEFAKRLGFTVDAVTKWERSATLERPVRGESARALDTALEMLTPTQLARMCLAPGIEDEVNRRQFGFGTAAIVGATLVVDSATAQASVSGQRIGFDDVRALVDYTEAIEQRDQREGGAFLVDEARIALAVARQQLDVAICDPITGTAAASAVGNLATITGFLAYDADDQDLARECYSAAMDLASRSGDDELTVHTLCNRATQEITLSREGRGGNPYLALQNIARAEHLAGGWRPGRIHALIRVRAAQAHARIGDADGFRIAMDDAHRALDAALNTELITHCPRWLRFVDPAELAGHEARAYSDLGDHRAALNLYETALQGQGRRNTANAAAWHANTRAAVGDLQGALEAAEPVLLAMEGSGSGRPAIRSPRTLRVLAPIRQIAGAGDGFIDRYNKLDKPDKKALSA